MDHLLKTSLENLNPYLQAENLLGLRAIRSGEIWLEIKGEGKRREEAPALTYDYWKNLCQALSDDKETGFDVVKRPVVASRLPDGHRFDAFFSQALEGENFSVLIRLKPQNRFNFADFGLPEFLQEKLTLSVEQGQNILVSGDSESGKTTFLNCLMACRPEHSRIAVIDEARELEVKQSQASSYSLNSQEKSASWEKVTDQINKSHPDLIVTAEMRVDNTSPLLGLLTAGQKVMTTVRADCCRSALEKEIPLNLALEGRSPEGVADFLKKTVDYVVHLKKIQEDNLLKIRVTEIWQPQTGYTWDWQKGESYAA